MDKVDNKISVRQLMIIFVLGVTTSILRVAPAYCSSFAKEATWLSPILSLIPIFILIYVLNKIMRGGKEESLDKAFEKIIGKPATKVLLFIYLLIMILFLVLRVRYFAEKCNSSIFMGVRNEFFIIPILFITYIVARDKLKNFARFSEFLWIPFVTLIVLVLLVTIKDIEIANIYPVTIYDSKGILYSLYPIAALAGYVTYALFLGENIYDRENFKKQAKKYYIYWMLIAVAIILPTIGVFGHRLSQTLSLSYFSALKNIEILKVFSRIESLAITLWIVTDLILMIFLTHICTTLIKKIFNVSEKITLTTPIIFASYVLSLAIASNFLEIEQFSRGVGGFLYLLMGTIVPIIIFLVGKVRKKI